MGDVDFAGLSVSLRAPRLAVAVPSEDWLFHAARAIEFLSGVWGGAGGVVVAVNGDGVHPAVLRLLERYSPDYLAPIELSLGDCEKLHPGRVPSTHQGVEVSETDRDEFIKRVEGHGPHMLGMTVGDEALNTLNHDLGCFWEHDGRRIYAVHPDIPPPRPLVACESSASSRAVIHSTGDPRLDLALGAKTGLARDLTEAQNASSKGASYDTARLLIDPYRTDPDHVFGSTVSGLSHVASGWRRMQSPLIVFGNTANDLSLAMLWERTVGNGSWLPVTLRHTRWLAYLGVALAGRSLRPDDPLLITSTSLTRGQCLKLMDKLWGARYVKAIVDDEPERMWSFVDSTDLNPGDFRTIFALNNKFDQRFSVPVKVNAHGTSDMVTPAPLVMPDPVSNGGVDC